MTKVFVKLAGSSRFQVHLRQSHQGLRARLVSQDASSDLGRGGDGWSFDDSILFHDHQGCSMAGGRLRAESLLWRREQQVRADDAFKGRHDHGMNEHHEIIPRSQADRS